MWDKARRSLILCLLGGAIYSVIEQLWRGYTHWSMFALAALLSIPLDQINERMSWDTPIWLQAILGAFGITVVELLAGLILNVWLGLQVWDYSGLPGNLWGQICPQYSLLWVPLAGFGIVLFDFFRWWLFGEDWPWYVWSRKRKGINP